MRYIQKINRYKTISLLTITLSFILLSCNTQNCNDLNISRDNFPDVLNVKNTPQAPVDWESFCFSDQGAWFGFALPDSSEFSFTGPFLMTNGKWIGKSILKLAFSDQQGNTLKSLTNKSTYYPGKLVQEINFEDFNALMSLIFISSNQALVQVDFKNIKKDITVNSEWSGSIFNSEGTIITDQQEILIKGNSLKTQIRLSFNKSDKINQLQSNDSLYTCKYSNLNISENNSLSVLITFDDERSHDQGTELQKKIFLQININTLSKTNNDGILI